MRDTSRTTIEFKTNELRTRLTFLYFYLEFFGLLHRKLRAPLHLLLLRFIITVVSFVTIFVRSLEKLSETRLCIILVRNVE